MYFTLAQLKARYKVDSSTLYRWRKKPDFPKAAQLGPGTVRYKVAEIEAWEAANTQR